MMPFCSEQTQTYNTSETPTLDSASFWRLDNCSRLTQTKHPRPHLPHTRTQRLAFWGEPRAGESPEDWVAVPLRGANSVYPGKFCRVRRALQPLYDACLHTRGNSGAAWWHDHLGHFWRGINT